MVLLIFQYFTKRNLRFSLNFVIWHSWEFSKRKTRCAGLDFYGIVTTLETLRADTLVSSRTLSEALGHLRKRTAVLTAALKKPFEFSSYENNSHNWPTPVTDTFPASQECPLTGASTVSVFIRTCWSKSKNDKPILSQIPKVSFIWCEFTSQPAIKRVKYICYRFTFEWKTNTFVIQT